MDSLSELTLRPDAVEALMPLTGSPGKDPHTTVNQNWEVLNGVGVDGVGVIFPFFYAFFRFFYAFFPFFFAFLCFS